ncbi:J domain-containing protein [Sporobolomyces salmoneus]|uniref:J domain-containing protein n=1 Tax=Sporobolomyces salmoneus TaxID=183962 RepID=UPI00317278FB
MRITLSRAHEVLQVEPGSSIEVVRTAYKRLASIHHPNGNSPESTAKFQEIGGSYARIVEHLERPEPQLGAGMRFPFSFRPPGFEQYDDADGEEEYWSDDAEDLYDSDEEMDMEDEYYLWLFSEILRGGTGSYDYYVRSYSEGEETVEEDDAEEDEYEGGYLEEISEELAALEIRAKEEMARIEKEKEAENVAARRQEKKKAALASKSAAQIEAAQLAQKRLASAQQKRSSVFASARNLDSEGVKRGIWELNVDPNGGEFLPGGKEAISELKKAGIKIDDEKPRTGKKKAKRNKGKSANKSKAAPEPPNIPRSFPPTPSPSNASPVIPHTSELPGSASSPPPLQGQGKVKKRKNKKSKSKQNVPPPSTEIAPQTPPPESEHQLSPEANSPEALTIKKNFTCAVPEERNSEGFTSFHIALANKHVDLVSQLLSDLSPPFPPPSYSLSSKEPTQYYPCPKNHSLLSLALVGGAKDPSPVLELARLVLPFVGGREISKGWKKATYEQSRRYVKEWKWEVWEEIKWLMAERAQALEFDGFLPEEEYRGRRPRVF